MSLGGGTSHPPSTDKPTDSLRPLRHMFVSHVKSSATSQRQILAALDADTAGAEPVGPPPGHPQPVPPESPAPGAAPAVQGPQVPPSTHALARGSRLPAPPTRDAALASRCSAGNARALRPQPCGNKAQLYLLISVLMTSAGTGFIKGNISLSQNANY